MSEAFLAETGLYMCWTKDGERLREITRVCESLRVLSGTAEAGFPEAFGMGEGLLTQVGLYERRTRACERLREITRVYGC